MKPNLVIAPHVDDEVIGCGGILDDSFHVFFCGLQEHHILPARERIDEIDNTSKYLGYSWELYNKSKVNFYDCRDFIDPFQELINKIKPEKIFIPFPSYNQDHQEICNAAMIALRPHDKNFFVKKVLVYESTDMLWDSLWEPTYFVPINIDKKIKAYECHASQVRGHRPPDYIRAMARERGQRINVKYAEAFITKRWVE